MQERITRRALAGSAAAVLVVLAGTLAGADAPRVLFAKPHYMGGHFAVEPRIPLCVDMDQDGFPDLACVYPPGGGILDIGLSEKGQKWHAHAAVAHGLGGEPVIAASRAGEIAWVTREGKLFSWSGYTQGRLTELARVGAAARAGAGRASRRRASTHPRSAPQARGAPRWPSRP